MFDKFYNRLEISGKLVATTALYIGAGQDSYMPSAVQGALLRDSQSQPYIPGSSIKGVLRSFLESVQDQENACYMGKTCTREYQDGKKRKTLLTEMMNETKNDELAQKYTAETIAAIACPACRLFGSGQMAGKVKIADIEFIITFDISAAGIQRV